MEDVLALYEKGGDFTKRVALPPTASAAAFDVFVTNPYVLRTGYIFVTAVVGPCVREESTGRTNRRIDQRRLPSLAVLLFGPAKIVKRANRLLRRRQ